MMRQPAEQTDNQKEDAEQFVAGVRPAAALGAEIAQKLCEGVDESTDGQRQTE